MNLLATYRGPLLVPRATTEPPFGPGFPAEDASRAERLEVWGTPLDADADFTEFRLMEGDRLLGIRRLKGF